MNEQPHSVYEYEVQWGDCDPADIVFYPNYYRWFDNAGHRMFSARGFSLNEVRQKYQSVGFPLVNAEAQFRKPSRVGDKLLIESTIIEMSRKTVVVQHRVHNHGELIVIGKEIRIFGVVDDAGILSAEVIPAELRTAFDFDL